MLLRRDPEGVVAITQPCHSAVSGQLAAAWGNDDVAVPAAGEEWRLACAIHDLGWLEWEQAPTRDPASGWPQSFRQVPTAVHVALWRRGVAGAAVFGRVVALLVSAHAETIYTRYADPAAMTPEDRDMVSAFLSEQAALRGRLIASLERDPRTASFVRPDALAMARGTLTTLDAVSLALCHGVREPMALADVPVGPDRTTTLRLDPTEDGIVVTPWPFRAGRLELRWEGRRLSRPCASDEACRQALAAADPFAMSVVLRRA